MSGRKIIGCRTIGKYVKQEWYLRDFLDCKVALVLFLCHHKLANLMDYIGSRKKLDHYLPGISHIQLVIFFNFFTKQKLQIFELAWQVENPSERILEPPIRTY